MIAGSCVVSTDVVCRQETSAQSAGNCRFLIDTELKNLYYRFWSNFPFFSIFFILEP